MKKMNVSINNLISNIILISKSQNLIMCFFFNCKLQHFKYTVTNYDDEWQGKEYVSNILKQYLISFSVSPFNVSETYLQVQYQKSKFYASVNIN